MAFGPNTRRSLKDRLREGIQQIPFQANKSRSVDAKEVDAKTTTSFHLLNPFSMNLGGGGSNNNNSNNNNNNGSESSEEKTNNGAPTNQNKIQSQTINNNESLNQIQIYIVKENDTLTSVAANFDLTPSELIKANRLHTRLIFPGQKLKIPPKTKRSSVTTTPKNSPEPVKSFESLAQQRKFIKLNVRHITDGNGVVSGVLLVTPNCIMFDPNVSDPLVLEQGCESYGVILPLELIVNAGLYSDICHMKVKGKEPIGPKPELFQYSREEDFPIAKSEKIVIKTDKEEVPTEEETNKERTEGGEEEDTNKEEEEEGNTNTEIKPDEEITQEGEGEVTAPNKTEQQSSAEEQFFHDSGFETGRPSPAPVVQEIIEGEETKKQKVLKRLSFPLTWMESISGGGDKHCEKEETQSAPPDSKINYRSLVSLEDKPDLFASFEKLLSSASTNNNKAYTDDTTWYLCLTLGKPKNKKLRCGLFVSYGQKKIIKPEYWFSMQRDQTDDFYKFWMLWFAHIYGELDEKLINERGYELVDWDAEIYPPTSQSPDKEEVENNEEPSTDLKEELNELTKESWEMIKAPYCKLYSFTTNTGSFLVVSMSEELRRALYGSEEFVPELIGTSEILEEEEVKTLGQNLTARAEGYPWILAFSTSRDGFSLNSLYRKMQGIESPILIVVEDTKKRVFGALVSCSLQVSDHFYGTGQSFLYNSRPEFQIFKWTGENMYFIKGNNESLAIGAGEGKFGLWIDSDLNFGRTEETATYGNPPLVPEYDFTIKTIECWSFGR